MSTSDAGESELRVVVGGETATPQYGTARAARCTAARELQNETVSEKFRNHCDGTATGQQCHPSAVRQEEETHKALTREEAARCGDSQVQTQKPAGPSFTSCLSVRFSRRLDPDNPELGIKKNLNPCLYSVMSVLCVNVVTANMLLSLFFLSGVLADCPEDSDLFITVPKKMEALSGSCLQIPCNFRPRSKKEFKSSREIFGVWIKSNHFFSINPHDVIFNSRRTNNIYPIKITGNLREKNCTTLFSSLNTSYTSTYYFRIESKLLKATAYCDRLQITVEDFPRRPTFEISGDLKEKESVTITCSAFTPCPHSPPKLTWNLQQDAHNKIEENTDGTFTTKIQETITLSEQHDGYNISCSATYPVNEGKDVKTAEETKTLSVSYAPKDTSVSISASAGSWVNLTCSSRAKPPVSSFTWFRISKDGLMKVAEGHFYSFNVTDGGDYYCVATNDLGNQTSSQIHLNVAVKILGVIMLYSTIVIFECCFRSRCCNKPVKDSDEEDCVNRVIEIQAS
ncbi:B-cell receptor CD22-like isoform 2-T2 [Acanthopagrus schlegelii]